MTETQRAIGHLERIAKALDRAAQETHGLVQVINVVNRTDKSADELRDIKFYIADIEEKVAKLGAIALMGKLRA